jgi:translation initiation factor 5B
MTFAAGNCQVSSRCFPSSYSVFDVRPQTTANYIVSQLAVWEVDFPAGISNDNVKWRALIWAISEALLVLSVAINYLPPRMYSVIFRFSVTFIMLDFFLCVIWLPIGVSKTYGFRSAKDVFTSTCEFFVTDAYHRPTCASDNGTGAPPGWNWILCLWVSF